MFPNLMNMIKIHMQGFQQNPKHKNINKITSRYIIIKLQNQ